LRRNELIADLFYRMDKAEKNGCGISWMEALSREAGLLGLDFELGDFFKVIFFRPGEMTLG